MLSVSSSRMKYFYESSEALTPNPLLTDEKAADKSKDHEANHKGKALVRRPAIGASYDPSNSRIQSTNVVKALSHTIHDFIDVFAVVQGGPQSTPKELLDHGG